MNHKMFVAGIALLAVMLFILIRADVLTPEQTEKTGKMGKAEIAEETEPGAETEKEQEFQLKDHENIYYLTDNLPEFKDKLTDFLEKSGRNPLAVTALSKYEDHPEQETGKAKFYLQLDDGTVVNAFYDKGTGDFSFSECTEEIENIEDYGGSKTQAQSMQEPEYSEEGTEEIDFGLPVITDNEGQLASVEPDQKGLVKEVLVLLKREQEERRNLSVLSAVETGGGYEASLLFENPRIDGKYIFVEYDRAASSYQIELRSEEQ